jgi:hypothetical protein
LIQSGQFKLEWFDAGGKPLERQNEFTSRTECERFITQAEVLGARIRLENLAGSVKSSKAHRCHTSCSV